MLSHSRPGSTDSKIKGRKTKEPPSVIPAAGPSLAVSRLPQPLEGLWGALVPQAGVGHSLTKHLPRKRSTSGAEASWAVLVWHSRGASFSIPAAQSSAVPAGAFLCQASLGDGAQEVRAAVIFLLPLVKRKTILEITFSPSIVKSTCKFPSAPCPE